jgi:hypothetical protein
MMSQAIVSEAKSGRLLLRDAARLLGITPGSLGRYSRTLPL